ncbi:MAG: cytochrome c [Deltaproteobacteria bacterium]|nr:cytochrome c [Deltaproteobacteria bacterium]MDQ3300031.1 cytochrome c [Myxococcota bacterium]
MKVRLLLVLVLGAAACKPEAKVRGDGAEIYARMCVTCHGSTGKPSATMIARLAVRDLTAPELRDRITPSLVEAQVRKGSQNKLMPGFEGALSDAEIKAVSAYVASSQFLSPP